MKIKIIDLVAKCLNAEEMPKKIKYDGVTFEYDPLANDYMPEVSNLGLLEMVSTFSDFTDEVEIIEELKKIEKIPRCDDAQMTDYGELYNPTVNEENLRIKINELIDEINKLKEDL